MRHPRRLRHAYKMAGRVAAINFWAKLATDTSKVGAGVGRQTCVLPYRARSTVTTTTAQEDSEFWGSYLSEYYNTVDAYHKFSQKCLHQFFKTYRPPEGEAKLLEVGGAAVVSNLISAAPKCRDIVFGEFREDNREWMNCWLRKDPSSFDWQPFFSYVVRTLEGGTEKDVEERKELVRNLVKRAVPCDIFLPNPVEDKGPYDVVTTSVCLENVCMTNEEYQEAVAKLAGLLRPGGIFLMQAHEGVYSYVRAQTGKTLKRNPISREFMRESLESAGLSLRTLDILPRELIPAGRLECILGFVSLIVVAATKKPFQ